MLEDGRACIFHWLALPSRSSSGKGRVAGVKLVQTRLGSPDDRRRNAEPVHGSDFNFIVRHGDPRAGTDEVRCIVRSDTRAIELSNGSITVDRATGRTSNPRYYAGGDCVNGGREIVDAVADGKRAALAIAGQFGA